MHFRSLFECLDQYKCKFTGHHFMIRICICDQWLAKCLIWELSQIDWSNMSIDATCNQFYHPFLLPLHELIHLSGFLCRVVLTTSSEWGAVVTKLNVPADWKGFSLTLHLHIFAYTCTYLHMLDVRILQVKRLILPLTCRVADLFGSRRTIPGVLYCILHFLSKFRFILEIPTWKWSA